MAHQDPNLSYISTFLEINNQLMTDLSYIYTLIAIQPKEQGRPASIEVICWLNCKISLQCKENWSR